MKHIFNKSFIGTIIVALFLAGCSDILNEQPRSTFTPEYFKTEQGVIGGLTSLYADLRLYGSGYFMNSYEGGTDESTWGQNDDGNIGRLDFSGTYTISAQNTNSSFLWGQAFPAINTASGVIDNGADAGVSSSLVAEARFFRAFEYFLLVQTYGGVPLDLGAGELKFNTTPVRVSVRNTVPEVYTKCIFPDLLQAINDLGDARIQGGVTKTLAQLYLAKAYLTYGWWLENLNSVPTYPDCDRIDPDGHDAHWYFQQSYDVATTAITSPSKGLFGNAQTSGNFGLQPTFYDLNVGSNDRNSEILLYADHTESSEFYSGGQPGSLGYSTGPLAGPDNYVFWFWQFNYTGVLSSTSNTSWAATQNSVQRMADQSLGRPWTMNCPPLEVFYNTFADKTNDSRYDGTFVTSYRANFNASGLSGKFSQFYNANYLPIKDGDAVFSFLPNDITGVKYYTDEELKADQATGTPVLQNSGIGAGVLAGRSDFVIEPSHISRICYPGNWKLGTYRTDNNGGLGGVSGCSPRPYNIAKFSELYLIAAEAAVKGATGTMSARDLVNVLRARAGKWRWDNGGNVAKVQDNSAAMTAATPATITIDYILAERSREYFGEGYRWLDLVRTQKWSEYAATFTICGSNVKSECTWNNHNQYHGARTITLQNYLRPIPQGQIDGLDMSDADKATYQNPGY